MGSCVQPQVNLQSISQPKIVQEPRQKYKPPQAKKVLHQPDPRASFFPPIKNDQLFQNAQVQIQSAPVLSSDQQALFNQQPNNPAQDKKELLKNIDLINFQIQGQDIEYYGEVKVTNPATSIISWEKVTIMASSKYGKGRIVAFGSEIVWKESHLENNKCSVLLLRNTIRWVTKDKKNNSQMPYRGGMIGINQLYSFSQYLELADTFVDFTFISDLSEIQLASYDIIVIGDLFFDSFKPEDCKILQNYVMNGGGIITSFKAWMWANYGQGKKCKNWRKQCLHNIIFGPMGIQFGDNYAPLKNLTFKCNQKMQIKKLTIRQYVKNSNQNNQLFNELKEETKISFVSDYNMITDGIQTLQYGEAVVSSFSCPEDLFFPIIQVEGNTLMTAGFFGSGKLLLFGHSAIFTLHGESNIKLLTNILKWMCGQKTYYNIGLLMKSSWEDLILGHAPVQTKFSNIVTSDQIANKDVILVNYYDSWPQQLNLDMIQTLKSYVQNGGNIIFGSHGWVWGQYGEGSRNKNLKYDTSFASAVILKQFSVYLEQNFIDFPKSCYLVKRFEDSSNQNLPKDSAIEAFLKNDLLKVLQGAKSFSFDDSQVSHYLNVIKSGGNFNKICSIDTYHEIVDAFINSSFNIEKHYDKIPGNNKFYNNVFDIMDSLSYSCPPQQCRALPPSLNKYPGYATKKIVKKVVKVYKNRNKRVYIGLYVNPGEVIGIKHQNNNNKLSDIQLRLNHNLDLTDRDNGNLKRYLNISRVIKIKSKQFLFASPHGGLLYFQINQKSQSSEPLQFQFYGAYEAPYFNQEVHSAKDFKNIQKIDAPFFVFETKRLVIIGPTKKIFRSLDIQVQKMCNYWNGVINTIKEFRGSDPYPFDKDSIFNDIQLIMGYMHSGNPVHTHEDVTYQFLGCGKNIKKLGNWGIYHQFGHNHQDYKWTTNELVQVTNNICTLYCFWKIHNQSVFKSRWLMSDPKQTLQRFNKHIALPESQKMASYAKDHVLGLYLFAIIIDEFSFEVFKNLHRKYDKIETYPDNDQQKYDILAEQLSLVTGYNMWPYLKKWGFPLTASSQNKVSRLKQYKCKRHPNLTS